MPNMEPKKQVLSGLGQKVLRIFEVLIFGYFDFRGKVTECVHMLNLFICLNILNVF